MKKLMIVLMLSLSGSVFATTAPPPAPIPVKGPAEVNLGGVAVFAAVTAGMAILMYKDSQRAPRACDTGKKVTAHWTNAPGYNFETTACDFEINSAKMTLVK